VSAVASSTPSARSARETRELLHLRRQGSSGSNQHLELRGYIAAAHEACTDLDDLVFGDIGPIRIGLEVEHHESLGDRAIDRWPDTKLIWLFREIDFIPRWFGVNGKAAIRQDRDEMGYAEAVARPSDFPGPPPSDLLRPNDGRSSQVWPTPKSQPPSAPTRVVHPSARRRLVEDAGRRLRSVCPGVRQRVSALSHARMAVDIGFCDHV